MTSRPKELAWLRQELGQLLEQHKPSAVGFKRVETNVRVKPIPRIEAETVLQEVAAAGGIAVVESRLKAQIKRAIGFDGHARYITRAVESGPLGSSGISTVEDTEAALAGWSLLPKED